MVVPGFGKHLWDISPAHSTTTNLSSLHSTKPCKRKLGKNKSEWVKSSKVTSKRNVTMEGIRQHQLPGSCTHPAFTANAASSVAEPAWSTCTYIGPWPCSLRTSCCLPSDAISHFHAPTRKMLTITFTTTSSLCSRTAQLLSTLQMAVRSENENRAHWNNRDVVQSSINFYCKNVLSFNLGLSKQQELCINCHATLTVNNWPIC